MMAEACRTGVRRSPPSFPRLYHDGRLSSIVDCCLLTTNFNTDRVKPFSESDYNPQASMLRRGGEALCRVPHGDSVGR